MISCESLFGHGVCRRCQSQTVPSFHSIAQKCNTAAARVNNHASIWKIPFRQHVAQREAVAKAGVIILSFSFGNIARTALIRSYTNTAADLRRPNRAHLPNHRSLQGNHARTRKGRQAMSFIVKNVFRPCNRTPQLKNAVASRLGDRFIGRDLFKTPNGVR